MFDRQGRLDPQGRAEQGRGDNQSVQRGVDRLPGVRAAGLKELGLKVATPQAFDSIAVDALGNILVATLLTIWSMIYYLRKAVPEIRAKADHYAASYDALNGQSSLKKVDFVRALLRADRLIKE